MHACAVYICTCTHAKYMHASHLHGMEDPSQAKFMHGMEDPPMQSSCLEGNIHAKFMHGRGDPCKVHAWKGKVFTQRRYISTSSQYIDIIGTTWCLMMYQTLHQ